MTRAPFAPVDSRILESASGTTSYGNAETSTASSTPAVLPPVTAQRAMPAEQQRPAGIRPEVLQRVLQMIDQRFHEPLRVEDLGRHACLSPFHFARMFKISVGQAPHAYLTAKRMQHARDLLSQTTVPIAEVARRVGFRTQAHFSGVFRRQVGVTPGQFRRQHRGAEAAAEGAEA